MTPTHGVHASVYRGTGLANTVGETNFAGLPKGQAKELAAQIASGVQAVQLSRRVLEKDQVEFHEMRRYFTENVTPRL